MVCALHVSCLSNAPGSSLLEQLLEIVLPDLLSVLNETKPREGKRPVGIAQQINGTEKPTASSLSCCTLYQPASLESQKAKSPGSPSLASATWKVLPPGLEGLLLPPPISAQRGLPCCLPPTFSLILHFLSSEL